MRILQVYATYSMVIALFFFPNNYGMDSISLHILMGNCTYVRELIDADASVVNQLGRNGMMPLSFAVSLGEIGMVRLLLASGADVNMRGNVGSTAMHYAASKSKELVELLLAAGAEVDRPDDLGETPLHNAALQGKEDITALLIEVGANPNSTAPPDNGSSMTVTERLLHRVKNYFGLNFDNYFMVKGVCGTPLHYAVFVGHREISRRLVAAGADPFLANQDGKIPLQMLIRKEEKSCLIALYNSRPRR